GQRGTGGLRGGGPGTAERLPGGCHGRVELMPPAGLGGVGEPGTDRRGGGRGPERGLWLRPPGGGDRAALPGVRGVDRVRAVAAQGLREAVLGGAQVFAGEGDLFGRVQCGPEQPGGARRANAGRASWRIRAAPATSPACFRASATLC